MNVFKRGKRFLRNHGADIFSVVAGIGVIATGITAYNAGRIAENQVPSESDEQKHLQFKRYLLKPILCGTGTITSIYAARKYGKLKEESLLAACSALALYSRRTEQARIRTNEICDGRDGDFTGDTGSNREIEKTVPIEDTGTGDVIFTETFTGRRFRASLMTVANAMDKLQETFAVCGFVTLNDFYNLLCIEETLSGEVLGWTKDQMVLDPDYQPGEDFFSFDEALTTLAIQLQEQEDGTYDIHYGILPVGSLAGIGPCNY